MIFLILVLLFLIIFCLFAFLYLLNALIMRGHDLPTSPLAIQKIIEIIAAKQVGKNNFYDLGCGRGEVVLAVKKAFPEFIVVGIDKNPLQIFFAKLKSFLRRKKIVFQTKNLFKIDFQDADIVYTYLWYDLMPEIKKKLKKELKKEAIVITNTSSFPNWQPEEIYIVHPKTPNFEKLFLYHKH